MLFLYNQIYGTSCRNLISIVSLSQVVAAVLTEPRQVISDKISDVTNKSSATEEKKSEETKKKKRNLKKLWINFEVDKIKRKLKPNLLNL